MAISDPSQIIRSSEPSQIHLIRECKAGIHCKAIGSTHRGGGSSRESEGRSMQTDRRLQTGACTRQTRMETSRQEWRQADISLYKADKKTDTEHPQ